MTGGLQDKVKKSTKELNPSAKSAKPTMHESMLWTNVSGCLIAGALALATGHLTDGIAFCTRHPEVPPRPPALPALPACPPARLPAPALLPARPHATHATQRRCRHADHRLPTAQRAALKPFSTAAHSTLHPSRDYPRV